MNITMNLLTE